VPTPTPIPPLKPARSVGQVGSGVAASGAVDDPDADTEALARQDAINVHGVVTAIRDAFARAVAGGHGAEDIAILADPP